jgi:hypothetical protein
VQELESSHTTAAPGWQFPLPHTSPLVQAFPSSQGALFGVWIQAPSHESTVQGFWSSQSLATLILGFESSQSEHASTPSSSLSRQIAVQVLVGAKSSPIPPSWYEPINALPHKTGEALAPLEVGICLKLEMENSMSGEPAAGSPNSGPVCIGSEGPKSNAGSGEIPAGIAQV